MPRSSSEPDAPDSPGERLQKVLAAAGLGSRRDCEELILAGRVEVDRQVVTQLGTRVDTATQEIRVDGENLRQPKRQYFAVNKPLGVVTTNFDPSGRPRVIDLVPTEERVFAVGRLDRASEGLILVTNDGEFANRLTHPRYGVEKTYLVRVAGSPDQRQLARLRKGVHLAEGFARIDSVTLKKQQGKSTDMTIVLSEGRNREIRRILARVGHKVLALKRIAVGNVKLADLPKGASRRLTNDEVQGLLAIARQKRRKAKSPSATAPKPKSPDTQQPGAESEYIQKQALLAQPLTLEDLLRDDLDEGPLTPDDLAPSTDESPGDEAFRGAIIDDQADFAPSPPRRREGGRPKPAGQKKFSKRGDKPRGSFDKRRDSTDKPRGSFEKRKGSAGKPDRAFDKRRDSTDKPRESFGKKRGGQRALGPPLEDRGAAGVKTGKIRFGAKRKKAPRPKIEGSDNQRRGKRRGKQQGGQAGKKFGGRGGKRKGRR